MNNSGVSVSSPEVVQVVDHFLGLLQSFFGDRLLSLVLYGSVCFDDLAPGYGDLDFLAIVSGDLSEGEIAGLACLRRPLRAGEQGILGQMLEGAFLPRVMLDPEVAGRAFWWGTSGERPWDRSRLGALVLHVIRERGVVVWGRDLRSEIPAPTQRQLLADVDAAARSMATHGQGGGLHAIDWLLTAARLLLWLREGRLSSKSEAAAWGAVHASPSWRHLLPEARRLRLDPASAATPAVQRWLDALTEPIHSAASELTQELARYAYQRNGRSR